MKMRSINQILAAVIVIANILALIAVLTGMHTTFGIAAVAVSLAVGLGMYLRIAIGTASLRIADKQEEVMRFAIAQQNDPEVVRMFTECIRTGDTDFMGAQIADLTRATDLYGNTEGLWMLMIGTRSSYETIRKKLADSSTVLDYWPVNLEKWAQDLLEYLLPDQAQDDAIPDMVPELKG